MSGYSSDQAPASLRSRYVQENKLTLPNGALSSSEENTFRVFTDERPLLCRLALLPLGKSKT